MTKPVCTIMVGLPALGKSYLISNLLRTYGAVDRPWIYSTDMFIDTVAEDNGITYDEAFLSNIDSAIKFNEQKVNTMISLQKDIIWDQTNLGVAKRKKIIYRMKQAGYRVDCVCILPPNNDYDGSKEDWALRLRSREGKTIPNHVLANMIESFVEPTIEEGFDMITFYNMHSGVVAIEYKEDLR